jgi:hypothetical protein
MNRNRQTLILLAALSMLHLGWGLSQTAYQRSGGKQHGDGKARPGIEVAWSFEAKPALFDVTGVILADEETTPEWRAGWLEK